MPIYEYRCGSCKERVEVLVRSSKAIPLCPNCGSRLSDKLFSVPNILSTQAQPRAGHSCCGQTERCQTPPCADGGPCCHN